MHCPSYYLCSSFFFFKQKTAYEMRIMDWSSDVCSSDLVLLDQHALGRDHQRRLVQQGLDPPGRRHRDEQDQQQAEEQDVERQPPDEVHRVPDEGEEGGDGTVAVALAGLVHCGSSWWSRDWGLGIGDSASRPALSPTPNPVSRIPAFPQDSPPAVTFSCAIGHRGDPLPGRGAQETRAEQDGGDH